MLGALKALIRLILSPSLYAATIGTAIASVVKRAEWALYLLILLIPLPNVWYKLQDFPLGKDILDVLELAVLLGIFVNKGGFDRPRWAFTVTTLILIAYAALWNSALRFGLPMPVTDSNPFLADWKNYAQMIFLYFLAYNALKDENSQRTALTVLASVFLLIVVREFRNFAAGSSFSYDNRAAGPFWIVGLGANHFGAFIATYGAALLGLTLIDKHRTRRWIYAAGLLFCIYPFFYSYSRGAYVAAIAAIVVIGLVHKRVLLIGVLVLLVAWKTLLPPTVVERITMTRDESGQIEASAAHRLELWEHAEDLFKANPVFGIGFSGFGLTVERGELTDTHNFYVKMAAEQGVIGLAAFAAILLCALASGWKLYRSARSDLRRGLGLGFMACTISMMVNNIFGDRWSYYMLGAYFWILWGIVDRCTRSPAQTVAEPHTPAPQHREVQLHGPSGPNPATQTIAPLTPPKAPTSRWVRRPRA
jgi:O-antigen ligase